MSPEDWIKSRLDGHFYSRCWDGHVRDLAVPRDYTPTHEPPSAKTNVAKIRAAMANRRPWTPDEDASIVSMRADGFGYVEIAKALRRGDKGVIARYKKLCTEAGIVPVFIAPCKSRQRAGA
ncbi:MAG TPA: hypothetical protein VK196_17105 [Magnetospirillum sp.]|nr:hypothetical protein [Magnetospirillum sp.]